MSSLLKAILHRTSLFNAWGLSQITISWGIGRFVSAGGFTPLDTLALILPFPAFVVFVLFNWQLVRGRWNLARWARYCYVWYFVFANLWFALLFSADPGHVELCILGCLGGMFLMVGVFSFVQYASLGLGVAASQGIFLWMFDPIFFKRNPLLILVYLLSILTFFIWTAVTSRYVQNLTDNFRKHLNQSRRDRRAIADERAKSEKLLLNILPAKVALELKSSGRVNPMLYKSATVMFTDFKGFTRAAEQMTPEQVITELDQCFSFFDSLMSRYKLEKLKTIGDSYMCVGGVPEPSATHAIDAVLAALEIQDFMLQIKSIREAQGMPYWELRLGLHSGPLIAGVIGETKFAYDVWGDTVNTASRLESSGLPGRVNISRSTYELVSDFFSVESRGSIDAKNKGRLEMFFVAGVKPHLSADPRGRLPNDKFQEMYTTLASNLRMA